MEFPEIDWKLVDWCQLVDWCNDRSLNLIAEFGHKSPISALEFTSLEPLTIFRD